MTYQPSMAKSFSTYLRRNEEEENRDEEEEDVELDMDSPAAKDFYYNPLAHEKYGHKLDFTARCKDIYFTQEGAYQNISKEEMDKYLPEGACGEMDKEFEASGSLSWMIRDSTKLVYRIIDEFKNRNGESIVPRRGLRETIKIPYFTDMQVKWPGSYMEVFSYSNRNLATVQDPIKKGKKDWQKIVRGPDSAVEKCLASIKEKNKNSIPNKVLLTGQRGVGKSAILSQAVFYARKNGYICLYIPSAWMQLNGGMFIEPIDELLPNLPEYSTPSSPSKRLFDNTFMSADILRGLYYAHHEDLKNINISEKNKDKIISKYSKTLNALRETYLNENMGNEDNVKYTDFRETYIGKVDTFRSEDILDAPIIDNKNIFDIKTHKLQTLNDLLLFGLAFRDYAGLIFIDIFDELQLYKEKPILIAIDEMNTWDNPSVYRYDDNVMTYENFLLPNKLKFISPKKEFNKSYNFNDNTLCIGTTTLRYPVKKVEKYMNNTSSLPLAIKIPCYTDVEFLSSIKYYISKRYIDNNLSDQHMLTYRMHCGSNPRFVRKNAGEFFNPISGEEAGEIYYKLVTNGGVIETDTIDEVMRNMNPNDASHDTEPDILKTIDQLATSEDEESEFSEDENDIKANNKEGESSDSEEVDLDDMDDFDVDLTNLTDNEIKQKMQEYIYDSVDDYEDLEKIGSEYLLNNYNILGFSDNNDEKYKEVNIALSNSSEGGNEGSDGGSDKKKGKPTKSSKKKESVEI
jgi:hypothetical protein